MPTPRPYQEVGAQFLAARRNAILGDDMGLGKTAQALLAARSVKAANILIVCPATLKENWRDEIGMWLPERTGDVVLLKGRNNRVVAPITIVNYDILKANFGLLLERRWDLCIADEVHYIKESTSQRTKALLGLRTEIRWALSGTPLLNRPIELYPVLWWLRQPIASSKREFGTRYCAGFYDRWTGDWNYRGSSNEEELRAKIGPIMLRRLKGDVLAELPPKTKSVVRMDIGASGMAEVDRATKAAEKQAGFQTAALSSGGFNFGSLGELAKLRAILGEQKAPAAVKYIRELAEESSDKIIVFGHHTAVLDRLETGLRDLGVVRIDGSTAVSDRQRLVKSFQTDPALRIFIGNIKAAGVGITLTAAPTVVFAEYDWTPGVNEQAEDRAHRFGQNKPVNIFYLVVDKSIDALIADVLLRKEVTLKTLLKKSTAEEHQTNQERKNTMEEDNRTITSAALGGALDAIGDGFKKAAAILLGVAAVGSTASASSAPAAPKADKPAKAPKAEKPAKPSVSKEQLVARIQEFLADKGKPAAKEILTKLGYESVKDIKAEDYDKAYQAFELKSPGESTDTGFDL